ncbi:BamA/TamA family outer membrane protein [Phormidium sp. CLA17]|nr:BamA/TamA family outer membrane protein [Leptolyngbya sp. Cla-17]
MPSNQPSSLNEPVWVMPTTVPSPAAPLPVLTSPSTLPVTPPLSTSPQQVVVPKIEPPPPGQTPLPPVRSQNLNDLALFVTEVQIAGVAQDLQEFGLQAIQTKAGGQANSGQLQNDVALLLNTGFFSSATVSTRPNPQGVSVTFFATPTIVRAIALPTAQALTFTATNEIFKDQFGKPISPTALNQATQQINDWYAQNGYTLARVISLRPDRNGIITIEVAEGVVGETQVRFVSRDGKSVDEKGQPIRYRTQDAFLQRQIKVQPGQPFQTKIAQEDLQRLGQLGIFETVSVAFEGDARRVTVIYNVTERAPRDLRFGGGFNDSLGLYATVGVQDINFGGLGQRLGGTVLVGTRDVQFDGRFVSPYRDTEPNVPGYNASIYRQQGFSQVFTDEVNLPNGDRIRERRQGVGIGLERPIGNGWNGNLGFNYNNVSIRDSDGKVSSNDSLGNPLTLSGKGIDDLFSLSFTAIQDLRDYPLNPGNGSVTRLNVEQYLPIGRGQVFGTKLQAEHAKYFPVKLITANQKDAPPTERQPEVIALNVQGGTNVGDLPPYNAFILGGANSVRGWDTGDIATPRSYIQATAEYRFPIYKFIGGTAFVDFASDLGSNKDVLGEPGVVRGTPGSGIGYGLGVRVNSPLGIIRADFGFSGQGDTRFQFGFGQRF